jgi:hypothetical protein
MYAWERDALDIGTLGEIQRSIPTRMRIETGGMERAAWWLSTLFGPDFWTHWRVGLLRPTLVGVTDEPVAPPEPLLLTLPKHLSQRFSQIVEPMDYIAVCPAIVEEKALAFGAIGVTEEEAKTGRIEPNDRWVLVAPTDLADRLKIVDGATLNVRLLPATYRARAPHRR